MATILTSIPKDANVTKIDYEGPRIALYTDKPRFLMENNEIISNLVNQIKKRIVIRTDEKIRKSEEDARKILDTLVPDDAGLEATFFDTATGEVSIEVKRPWLMAFGFGLLHGFGFAGALSEIGIANDQLFLSLLFFNIGIEIGQLMIIPVVGIIIFFLNKADLKKLFRSLVTYGIGGMGCFWFMTRLWGIVA